MLWNSSVWNPRRPAATWSWSEAMLDASAPTLLKRSDTLVGTSVTTSFATRWLAWESDFRVFGRDYASRFKRFEANLASFREAFPKAITSQELFEIDRNRYTCSGGTAPLDLMLTIIRRDHGPAVHVLPPADLGLLQPQMAHQARLPLMRSSARQG